VTLVVDCSVALKWVFPEEGREAALDLIGRPMWAPDFLKLECANLLAAKVWQGAVPEGRAIEALEEIAGQAGLQWRSTSAYVFRAQRLAMTLKQTAYDCLYLAMAIEEGLTLVTAGSRFAAAIETEGSYAAFLQRLGGRS